MATEFQNTTLPATPGTPSRLPYHAWPSERALAQLKSRPEGLTSAEASERLRLFGENVLPRARGRGPLLLLWSQINTPLIWVLIGSSVIAMLVDPSGGMKNGIVILSVVILNTVIGFIQEYRAGRAIEALVEMVPEQSTVIRDGKEATVPASQLVPGDIVRLASGDKVPADMRIVHERNLQTIESALTGESLPTRKTVEPVAEEAVLGDRSCQVFGGTLVTFGAATAVVTATGSNTELGRISSLLNETTDLQTPLTKALASIGRILTGAIIVLSMILLALGTWRTMSETGVDLISALRETAIFAIALAVGAIPEGLPAIVTITLAIGVQRMAARRAVIRKLPAVETLGSTTVICTDKTGTLTRNEMTVQEIWTPTESIRVSGVGYAPNGQFTQDGWAIESLPPSARRLLEDAVLCNDSSLGNQDGTWSITGDPTEGALLTVAAKAGLDLVAVRDLLPRLDAIPFESENQYMATLHDNECDNDRRLILKGAPEVILKRSNLSDELELSRIHNEIKRLASQGMRVLAVAEKTVPQSYGSIDARDLESGFAFMGLQGMIDPPRTEAMEAIKACHAAGITVKMITGDHPETAQAIGRELGLLKDGEKALYGRAIEGLSESELRTAANGTNVFARVAPEHKLKLVKALQMNGHVVAMTGDGVNDAPALKQSNIGVAMGITGTAVSKESADIVLTDDNFSTIEAAIEEGRRVYDNLVKSLAFVLPTNLGLALVLIYAVLFFPFRNGELLVPMLPTQILWINLVATIALALPLAFEAKEPNIMHRPPRAPDEPVLSSFVITRTFLTAALMTAGAVGLFSYEYRSALSAGMPEPMALAEGQTMAVTTVIMFQIFYMLNCRSLRGSVWSIGLFTNTTIYIGIAALLALQAAFIYWEPLQNLFGTKSLSLADLGFAALIGAIILPVISIEKWYRNRRVRRREPATPAGATVSEQSRPLIH